MFTPKRFRIAAILCAGIWLVIAYPLMNGFARKHLPAEGLSNGGDFSQYYSGSLSVKLWRPDTLYPVPREDVYRAPSDFRPIIPNPWFDRSIETDRAGNDNNWAFYPQVSSPQGSTVSPELLKRSPRLQGDSHYIYPPPLAFLLFPLAIFEYETSCRLWFFLMSASLFGIGVFSVRTSSILLGHDSWFGGVAALLPALPTLLFSENATALVLGNVSPLQGLLIAACAYGFLADRQVAIALATLPLLLFKGIGLAWCPMLFIGKWKWRAILIMAILTVTLNGLTLWFGGIDIYMTFFREILPKASLPLGTGMSGLFMTLFGVNPGSVFRIASLILVVSLLLLHYRAIKAGAPPGITSLSSIVGMIAVFNLLNPVVWPHYFSSYLILPFSPWIACEIMKLKGKTRISVTILFCSVFLCWMDTVLLSRDSWTVKLLSEMDLYTRWVDKIRMGTSGLAVIVIPLFVTASTLFLAIRSLQRLSHDAVKRIPVPDHESPLASISPSVCERLGK